MIVVVASTDAETPVTQVESPQAQNQTSTSGPISVTKTESPETWPASNGPSDSVVRQRGSPSPVCDAIQSNPASPTLSFKCTKGRSLSVLSAQDANSDRTCPLSEESQPQMREHTEHEAHEDPAIAVASQNISPERTLTKEQRRAIRQQQVACGACASTCH